MKDYKTVGRIYLADVDIKFRKIVIDAQQLLDEITSDPRYELLYLKR